MYVCVFLQGNLFLDVRFRALDKDALNSSHAVSSRADTPEQVSEMFDSVSYEKVRHGGVGMRDKVKTSDDIHRFELFLSFNLHVHRARRLQGASILLMLNASLPGDLFRKGIVEYLKNFSGSNTVTDDLWNSISQVCPCVCVCLHVCACLCTCACALTLTRFIKQL